MGLEDVEDGWIPVLAGTSRRTFMSDTATRSGMNRFMTSLRDRLAIVVVCFRICRDVVHSRCYIQSRKSASLD